MSDLIELLTGTPVGNALAWFCAIILAAICVYNYTEKYRKARNAYETTQKETKDNASKIKELQENEEKMVAGFEEKFQCLEEHDKNIDKKFDDIILSISDLRSYNEAKDINDLKDRIMTKYDNFKKRKNSDGQVVITEQELEVFEGLIDSYSKAGGNSFVHRDIAPAIRTWKVISEDEINAIIKK